jgi:GT2 family glycosyltransferase
MNDFAVIIINFNSAGHTINCINSILSETSRSISYELLVVDNASDEKDFHTLKSYVTTLNSVNIQLVRSKINSGFGGGNMFGVQFAKRCKYYAFVNNDTLLMNDCLQILDDFFKETPEAAVCAPQQFNEHGEVQKSFDHFLSLKRELFGRSLLEKLDPKRYPKRNKTYDKPLKVESVPGSFLVVRSDPFSKVGGFDTNIFLYFEETDLCYRIYKNSNRGSCFLVPEARFVHLNGQSTAKNREIKKELKRSLLYVLKKTPEWFPT